MMGAIKAANAPRLALRGTGNHIEFDEVIETMRQIGTDMHDKDKETSQDGRDVNAVGG